MELFGLDRIPLTWILAIGAVTLIYVYGKWRNRVFKDAGIPGPEPVIYIGNLHQALLERSKGVDFDNPMGKKYGKVYGSFLGGIPMINVSDPDIAREILIKQFDNFTDRNFLELSDYPIDKALLLENGATWKRLRNIVSPTFSGAKLRLMCDKINDCAKTLTDNFLKAAEKNVDIDIKESLFYEAILALRRRKCYNLSLAYDDRSAEIALEAGPSGPVSKATFALRPAYFGAFTMNVIASTAFGIEMDSQNDTSNVFIREARRVFGEVYIGNPAFMIALIFPGLAPLFKALGLSLFPKGAIKFLAKAITEMIEQRKNEQGKEKRLDFLQLLLDAEDDEVHDDVTPSDQSKNEKKSKKMSHGEVLGQALLFFVAGYETTANTLHFAAYSLATNPDVQQRLVEEIDTVLGEREPDYDNINELTYLGHVITETLRMYPTVPAVTRVTKNTVQIQGYTFPKDCTVGIPSVVIQRDPDIYPEPHRFNPDRWERKSDIDPMNYLPFGHGPRHCLGMRLAQVEMKMALAQVLKKLTFVPAPDTPETLKSADLTIISFLGTKKPIFLRVKTR